MVRGRLFNFAKSLCFVLMVAFLTQAMAAQAESAGLVACDPHHSSSTPENHDSKNPVKGDQEHCCCTSLDFYYPPASFTAFPSVKEISFPLQDEIIPDGPTESIEHPPQIS